MQRKRIGRPRKSEGFRESGEFSCNLPPRLMRPLNQLAIQRMTSRNSIVRLALLKLFESEKIVV